MTDFFELGRILKPQGIQGEVKVNGYTDDINRFYELSHVYFKRNGAYVPVRVTSARADGRYAYLKLEGIADRNAAEPLRGQTLYIDRAHAAPLPEGSYYICDLIGLAVISSDGTAIGTLADLIQTGASDVYVVTQKEGGTLLFPAAPGVILERDVQNGRIVVDCNKLQEVAVYDL